MKVRIDYTVEVSDEIRRSISEWYGREHLATRSEIRSWYESNGSSMDADLSEMAGRREG